MTFSKEFFIESTTRAWVLKAVLRSFKINNENVARVRAHGKQINWLIDET